MINQTSETTLVQGTVADAAMTVTLTDGAADIDLSSATIPRNYPGCKLTIKDSAGREIVGWIYTNGAGTVQNIVSTKGGTTRSWAYKNGSFDTTDDYTYRIDRVHVAKIAGGRARGFNGTTQYLRNASSGISPGLGDFTVSAWVYFNTTPVTWENIFSCGNPDASPGFSIMRNNIGYFHTTFNDGSGMRLLSFTDKPLPSGQWYHVAVTYERSGNATGYVNGAASSQLKNISGWTGNITTSTTQIGAWHVTNAYKLPGRIARVKYWASLLSADNITADYNSGKGLRVAECTGIGTVPPAPDYGWDLEGGPAADEYAEAGAINLTQAGGVSEEEGPDAARGSIAAGSGKLSLVDGTAFADTAALDLSPYANGKHLIVYYDSSNRSAAGWLKAAGGGEARAAAKTVTGITKANPGVITYQAGHGYTNGELIYFSGLTEMTSLNTQYRTLTNKSGDTFQLGDLSGATAAETTGGAVSEMVTVPSATGATIVNAKDGTTYNWLWKTTGFDPNVALTYRIYYIGY